MTRWPTVRLVFHLDKMGAAQVMDRFRQSFIICAPTLGSRTRVKGAFRLAVQVHPEQEASFRSEVQKTQGVNIDT